MNISSEATYRKRLSYGSECLVDALDSVLPPDQSADDLATGLVRNLCFEPAQYSDTIKPAFSEQLPYMMDHGVRQVALAAEVLADDKIRDSLPDWLDLKLFGQAVLVADVGLAHVSAKEVATVHEFGPKYAIDYTNHPDYGYVMAQTIGIADPSSQVIASFIARHHMVQASNQYGMNWNEINHTLINPNRVDVMVALQKPFDYFDDCFDRQQNGPEASYKEQISLPLTRFTRSSGQLLCRNTALVTAIDYDDFNPGLLNQICTGIQARILDDTPIGEVYRELRQSLVTI